MYILLSTKCCNVGPVKNRWNSPFNNKKKPYELNMNYLNKAHLFLLTRYTFHKCTGYKLQFY